MCSRKLVDIMIPREDNEGQIIGPPIIEKNQLNIPYACKRDILTKRKK